MHKLLRNLSLGMAGLGLTLAVGCSHKTTAEGDRSEVSVTDDAKSQPMDSVAAVPPGPPVPPHHPGPKAPKPPKRVEAAAARAAEAPKEGSDQEYAADVDAAMGDTVSTAQTNGSVAGASAANSVAVNSAPDNSRVNRLNNGDVGLTADQQGNSKSDIEITRKIRKSITEKSELSTYAHNVKIITRDGRVVLKGPVRSETERQVIEDLAVNVAGANNVSSGIEIKAK